MCMAMLSSREAEIVGQHVMLVAVQLHEKQITPCDHQPHIGGVAEPLVGG